MNREQIAAQIRTDTTALLNATGAHIAIGIVLGSEGGVSECSHHMEPDDAAFLMRTIVEAVRVALSTINNRSPEH